LSPSIKPLTTRNAEGDNRLSPSINP
jgi:hypothetical protein